MGEIPAPPVPPPLCELLTFYRELGAEFLSVADPALSDTLAGVTREILQCQACRLHKSRRNAVPGEGSAHPDILFVGEGPGETEDQFGRPFIGKAGEMLDRIIVRMGYRREEVFIGNVVKCRPPANRVPARDEADTCLPFLHRQIALLQPRVVVCLGATALNYLLGMNQPISRNRGRVLRYRGVVPVVGTYHPAYLLRKENPVELRKAKLEVWQDMQQVLALLGRGGHAG